MPENRKTLVHDVALVLLGAGVALLTTIVNTGLQQRSAEQNWLQDQAIKLAPGFLARADSLREAITILGRSEKSSAEIGQLSDSLMIGWAKSDSRYALVEAFFCSDAAVAYDALFNEWARLNRHKWRLPLYRATGEDTMNIAEPSAMNSDEAYAKLISAITTRLRNRTAGRC